MGAVASGGWQSGGFRQRSPLKPLLLLADASAFGLGYTLALLTTGFHHGRSSARTSMVLFFAVVLGLWSMRQQGVLQRSKELQAGTLLV
jgi:hypothetical protein